MIGAVIKDNIVQNLIVLKEEQIKEFGEAIGCEIVDARPYGLKKGDRRSNLGWTRNAGGEQMVLPLLDVKSYDSYSLMAEKAVELEKANKTIAARAVDGATTEVLGILTGEVTE